MQSDRASNVENLRQAAKACVVLSPLLGITWVFGILSVTNAGLVFQYIFTILNSLQVTYGLLLLITYVAEVSIASIFINVRALNNLPRICQNKPATSTFPQMKPISFAELRELRITKLLIFPGKGQFSRNSSQFGSTNTFHLRTDPACQF